VWDVEELSKRITLRQLKWWMAFWRVEPFGDEWSRSGKLAAVTAAAAGAKVEPDFEERFLPSYRAPVQTEEELKDQLRRIPFFAKQMEEKGI
jgi:uncharacterized protein (DUF1697 family)